MKLLPQEPKAKTTTEAPAAISRSDFEASFGGEWGGGWNGDTFAGSFGGTQYIELDYEALRARCSEMFNTNKYARALIRRIVSNVIASGLWPELKPETAILGKEKGSLAAFVRKTETLFRLWSKCPRLASVDGMSTFGKVQADAYREALVGGDALVVWETDTETNTPRVKVLPGSSVVDPSLDEKEKARKRGNTIKTGVEVNKKGVHIAYWVLQDDRSIKKIPAKDKNTGRIISQMVYVYDRRVNTTRGEPLLSILLTSLKELDRFLTATQRKAALNASIALVVKKSGPARQLSDADFGGIEEVGVPTTTNGAVDAVPTTIGRSKNEPGVIMMNLPENLEPTVHSTAGTDINFPAFEEAIIAVMGWLCEVPPETLKLGYGSNYAASQTVNGEFNQFILKERAAFAPQICQPTLVEIMIGQVAAGDSTAGELVTTYNDSSKWATREAWTNSHWMGKIRPQADMLKNAKGLDQLIKTKIYTRTQAASHVSEVPWEQMVEQQAEENVLLMASMQPIADFITKNGDAGKAVLAMVETGAGDSDLAEQLEEIKEEVQNVN